MLFVKQVVKRPIDLPTLSNMISVNHTRFGDDSVREEWKRINATESLRQKERCQICLRCRDIESRSGQRKDATPAENAAARKAHSAAMTELEAHWESDVCKDRKVMGSGWIFDDHEPFNPDNAEALKVNLADLFFSCYIDYDC